MKAMVNFITRRIVMSISKNELKKEIKKAVEEVIKELIDSGEFYKILEDIALKKAIDEGLKSENVNFQEIFEILKE